MRKHFSRVNLIGLVLVGACGDVALPSTPVYDTTLAPASDAQAPDLSLTDGGVTDGATADNAAADSSTASDSSVPADDLSSAADSTTDSTLADTGTITDTAPAVDTMAADVGVDSTVDAGAGDTMPGQLTSLNDEFNDPTTLGQWTRLHQSLGLPVTYSALDIDGTATGHLSVIPESGGWYQDARGVFLFKEVTGDFVVGIRLHARRTTDPILPPSHAFNAAGLMARDPSSVTGDENWVVLNLGMQSASNGVGTEGKNTVASSSALSLTPGGNSGLLLMCRLGTMFHMYRWLDGESGWTLLHSYQRNDLPDTLQVGLMANGWAGSPPDLRAEFDWIRFARPTAGSSSSCPHAISVN